MNVHVLPIYLRILPTHVHVCIMRNIKRCCTRLSIAFFLMLSVSLTIALLIIVIILLLLVLLLMIMIQLGFTLYPLFLFLKHTCFHITIEEIQEKKDE